MTSLFIFLNNFFILPTFRIFTKETRGIENIPAKNGFIIVANHNDSLDHWFIMEILKDRMKNIRFIAASLDTFKTKLISSLVYSLGQPIIIDRKNGKREIFLAKVKTALENNQIVIIYPEGDTNRKNQLLKGKTGAAELALKTNCPILPVGLKRTGKLFQTIVNIGLIMDLTEERKSLERIQRDQKAYYMLLRKTTDKIMLEISRLCEKPYPF